MNKTLGIILIFLGLSYLGCAPLPAPVPETAIIDPSPLYDQIKEGVSTTNDVKAVFGDPIQISVQPDGEHWAYGFKNKNDFRPVTFKFNQQGIVTYKSISSYDTSWPQKQPMTSFHRHTDITKCAICGQQAVTFDNQRGPLCITHAGKSNTLEEEGKKEKRTQPKSEEDEAS